MGTKYTGNALREARENAGLTQQQVADGLDLYRTTVVAWEQRAKVPAPKAARYLRVVSELASERGAA